jgi:5-bromo-4-chloroindolyl phosphate hydrolysis protein
MFSDVASGYLNIFSFLPILFVMALFIFMNIFVYKQNVKKAAINYAANPENSSYFNMTDYTFSETGVTIKDDVKESKLQWKAFVKKQENAAYIYLFVTASSAYVIPKRIFKSEVQQEELNRLFGQYLSFDAEVGHLVKD